MRKLRQAVRLDLGYTAYQGQRGGMNPGWSPSKVCGFPLSLMPLKLRVQLFLDHRCHLDYAFY